MDADPSPRLRQDARIAVVGGGPAGSFFALHALHIAAQLGLRIQVTIFERKDLRAPGPRGCNMCAGILSHRVLEGIRTLGIVLPPPVVMGRVRTYKLHWASHSVCIQPPDPSRQVLSVYRAGGPRKSPYAPTEGLDAFLLEEARRRGARVVPERVKEIYFEPHPRVCTPGREESFDLAVLAAGVNASPPVFHRLSYAQPPTETMAQDALLIGTEPSRAEMDSTVHVYFDRPKDLIFGALIPKGHFATVSLLGRRLERESIHQFLELPQVTRVVGDQPPQMCGCRPRVAVGMARGYYADCFVAVGDACVTRLYKDGIGSAFVTARAAAETALVHGIGRQSFARNYAPVCRAIDQDNRFGRMVFDLIDQTKRSRLLMRALARAVELENRAEIHHRVLGRSLWSLFTGDANYSQILRMSVHPGALMRVGRALAQELWAR